MMCFSLSRFLCIEHCVCVLLCERLCDVKLWSNKTPFFEKKNLSIELARACNFTWLTSLLNLGNTGLNKSHSRTSALISLTDKQVRQNAGACLEMTFVLEAILILSSGGDVTMSLHIYMCSFVVAPFSCNSKKYYSSSGVTLVIWESISSLKING
jgi:hypothetical protein